MRGILLFVVLLMWKMDSNPMIIQHIISDSCKVHIMNRIAGSVASWCICRLGACCGPPEDKGETSRYFRRKFREDQILFSRRQK